MGKSIELETLRHNLHGFSLLRASLKCHELLTRGIPSVQAEQIRV